MWTYSWFMFRIARRDIITSCNAFLKDLQRKLHIIKHTDITCILTSIQLISCKIVRIYSITFNSTLLWSEELWSLKTYLMARYMGLMANRGKVCTLIIMVINTIYNTTLIKPTTNTNNTAWTTKVFTKVRKWVYTSKSQNSVQQSSTIHIVCTFNAGCYTKYNFSTLVFLCRFWFQWFAVLFPTHEHSLVRKIFS